MKDSPRLYPLNGRTATYAGRCDLVAKVNGVLYVIDFKTGTRPKKDPYYEWRLQTAAYRAALAKYEPKGNAVLHLDKVSGMPTFYNFSDTYEKDFGAFLHLARFYREMIADKFDPEKEAPSVTSIDGCLDKSAPLMWWATDCMGEYIKREQVNILSQTRRLDDVVDEAKRNYRKIAKEAADIGTQVHSCIEGFIRTGVEPKIEDERILAGFVAFLEWRDTVHLEVIAQEIIVYG